MFTSTDKILVSACLLGEPVRYDGQSKPIKNTSLNKLLNELQQQQRLIVVCPEVAGGLPIPRPKAEMMLGTTKVVTVTGEDVSEAFNKGAQRALELCIKHNIKYALLKAMSPSCGNLQIYDGSFASNLVEGQGITARLLMEKGINVYSELEVEELIRALKPFY